MNLHWLDISVLLLYMGALLLMGISFSKKNKTTESYFVGGRSYSGWVIGLSMVGTSISSVTFLAYPADGFKTAWLRFLPNLMLPLGIIISATIFMPFFRRNKTTSAYEYLENRFGPSVRIYGAITFILGQMVRLSMILYLLSLMIHEITDLDTFWCVLVGGVFVGAYTIIGGIEAVIWTDVIQTIVLVLGGILCLGVIINALPGGLSQIFEIASAENKFAFAEVVDGVVAEPSWKLSFSEKTASMMLILGLFTWLQEYATNQNVIQRYATAKSDKEAKKAMYVSMINVPIWAFYMFLGTALYAFYQVYPNIEAEGMLSGVKKAEQILPYFIINELPIGVTGLVIAAALAAAMSSLDSSIIAISTVGVHDIYRRFLYKNNTDKHYLKIAHLFAGLASCFMIVGALLLINADTKTLQDAATILISLAAAGIFGLYMFGFLTKFNSTTAAWIGISLVLIFSLWSILSGMDLLPEQLGIPFDLYYVSILGHLLMFISACIAAYFLHSKTNQKKNMKNLTVWTLEK